MGRTKGATNKEIPLPEVYTLSPEQRLHVIADLLIELICEEEVCSQE
jgi:hypothetical protein